MGGILYVLLLLMMMNALPLLFFYETIVFLGRLIACLQVRAVMLDGNDAISSETSLHSLECTAQCTFSDLLIL